MGSNRGYLQGSAVTLRIDFQAPDSNTPVDPASVILSALILNGITRISTTNVFIHTGPGTFETTVDTTNFQAGSYTWRFLAVDNTGSKFYGEDDFILLPITGPSGP